MNIRLKLTKKPAGRVSTGLQMAVMALLSPLGLLGFCLLSLTSAHADNLSPTLPAGPVQASTVDAVQAGPAQTETLPTTSRVSGLAVPGWDLL
jgi:hypothetical protein